MRTLHCEIADGCPLDCRHCYCRRTEAPKGPRRDGFWISVLEAAMELGVEHVVVSGGEPLLRPDLTTAMLELAEGRGREAMVLTSGWTDPAILAGFPRRTVVQVSLDGVMPDVHDAFRRRKGSWQRAVHFAQRTVAEGLRLRVSHMIRGETAGEARRLYALVLLLGAESLHVNPILDGHGRPDPETGVLMDGVRLGMRGVACSHGPRIHLSGFPDEACDRSLRITSDGNVRPFDLCGEAMLRLPEDVAGQRDVLSECLRRVGDQAA